MPASVFGLAIFGAQAVGLALLIAALFAPTYHYQSMALPAGYNAVFELSLFKVTVRSQCLPTTMISSISGFMDQTSCLTFVSTLNGRTLREVANLMCGIQFTLFGLATTGCTEFTLIATASVISVMFLTFGITLSFTALVLIVIFFLCRPTQLVRRGILGLQLAAIFLTTTAIFFYVAMGGSLYSSMFLGGIISGYQTLHNVRFSFGAGFVVLITGTFWACTMPIWGVWAVKLKYCEDYITEEDERDEEAGQLMASIRDEAAKLDPETAQSILNPVTAQDIINWYNAPK